MYILNINKSYGTNTPQILGRVADLPYMDFEFMFKDGTKAVDLTGCTVEFRGTTPTYNKIISTDSVKVKDAKNGTIDFKIPKNFYSAPGAFKRAYFAIKKNGRIDTTQDVIIHVLESVDMDAQDAQDVIDGLDKVIKEVTDKMNRETQAMIDEIQKEYDNLESLLQKQAEENIAKIDREIKIAIDESKLRIQQLESEYRGIINNAQLTLNQLQAELDKLKPYINDTNKKLDELNAKLKKIQDDLDRTDLLTQGDLEDFVKANDYKDLGMAGNNLISLKEGIGSYTSYNSNWVISEDGRSFKSTITSDSSSRLKTITMFVGDNKPSPGIYVLSGRMLINDRPVNISDFSAKLINTGNTSNSLNVFSLDDGGKFIFREYYNGSNKWVIHMSMVGLKLGDEITFEDLSFQKGMRPTPWHPSFNDIAKYDDVARLQKQVDEQSVVNHNNLIKGSSNNWSNVTVREGQWSGGILPTTKLSDLEINVGEHLILNADLSNPVSNNEIRLQVTFVNKEGVVVGRLISELVGMGVHNVTARGYVVDKTDSIRVSIIPSTTPATEELTYKFKKIKLQKSHVRTDWSPNIYELIKRIDDLEKTVTALGGS